MNYIPAQKYPDLPVYSHGSADTHHAYRSPLPQPNPPRGHQPSPPAYGYGYAQPSPYMYVQPDPYANLNQTLTEEETELQVIEKKLKGGCLSLYVCSLNIWLILAIIYQLWEVYVAIKLSPYYPLTEIIFWTLIKSLPAILIFVLAFIGKRAIKEKSLLKAKISLGVLYFVWYVNSIICLILAGIFFLQGKQRHEVKRPTVYSLVALVMVCLLIRGGQRVHAILIERKKYLDTQGLIDIETA